MIDSAVVYEAIILHKSAYVQAIHVESGDEPSKNYRRTCLNDEDTMKPTKSSCNRVKLIETNGTVNPNGRPKANKGCGSFRWIGNTLA